MFCGRWPGGAQPPWTFDRRLGRCGVDTSAARVHAWVDDAMSGTRDAPVAHLVAVEPLGPADDDALAAALGQGPELAYRAVEAE